MHFEIGMISSLRSKDSLINSINSIRNAKFNNTINLFIDPVEDVDTSFLDQFDNLKVNINIKNLGMVENTKIAWEYLFKNSNSPWLVVCEDDILCKPCLFDVLESSVEKINRKIGYISCYTPLIYSQMKDYVFKTFGWKKLNMGMNTWGTQFMLMQKDTCGFILSKWDKYHTFEKLQDRIIGEITQDFKLDCFYPYPSLVNHVGLMNSTHVKSPLIGNTAWLYGINNHEDVLKNYSVFE